MGRREITDRTAWEDGYFQVAYTADALELAGKDGDAEVGALAHKAETVLASWETVDVERRKGRRGLGKANALVRRRDFQCDHEATGIHNDLLAHVKQDRKHGLFRRFFADGLSALVKLGLASELPPLRKLALLLDEKETPAKLKADHAKPLAHAISNGDAALATREEAFVVLGRVNAHVEAWREDANSLLLGVDGVLEKLASERKLGRDWVDGFFPDLHRPAKKAAKPETTPPS